MEMKTIIFVPASAPEAKIAQLLVYGATVVLVEQTARLARESATYGYVLVLGRVVLEGSAQSLRGNRDVQEFYLGQRDTGVRGERRWKRKKQWR